ncbi:MAG: hypothetical protein CK424_00315 [Legionella sp.]|nr:MAG: hypothetical protein CK424_00315 [Legionella sp.]
MFFSKNYSKKDKLVLIKKNPQTQSDMQLSQLIIDADRAKNKVNAALNYLLNSNERPNLVVEYTWEDAYTYAIKADQLNTRLRDHLNKALFWPDYLNQPSPSLQFSFMLIAALVIPKMTGFITKTYELTPDQRDNTMLLLLVTPVILYAIKLYLEEIRLKAILVEPSLRTTVLAEAKNRGININISDENEHFHSEPARGISR